LLTAFPTGTSLAPDALNRPSARTAATEIIRQLIDKVTIGKDEVGQTILDVEAFAGNLIGFAAKKSPPPKRGAFCINGRGGTIWPVQNSSRPSAF